MADEKELKVLNDIEKTVESVKRDAGMPSKKGVSCGFLQEDIHDIRLDGLTFEDISAKIFDATEELFYLSRACDRFVPQYLVLCKSLKKAVEHLGSVFMTKTALNHRGHKTPKLDLLTAVRLNEMCSFNVCKLEQLFHQKAERDQVYDLEVFDLMVDYANLMARLRKSQSKAACMEFGLFDTSKYREGSSSFTPNKNGEKEHSDPASFREAPAFSADKAVIAQIEGGIAASAGSGTLVSDSSVPDGKQEADEDSGAAVDKDQKSQLIDESMGSDPSDSLLRSSLQNPTPAALTPGYVTENTPYQEILRRAKERNPESDELQLTIDEIMFCLVDSNFQKDMPELAEQCIQALELLDDSG